MPEMPEEPLRSAIDAIRTRLHDELEAQLSHLSAKQQEELDGARRAAEAETERRVAAETQRVRAEAEQAAAAEAARVREELERALADERGRAQNEINAERERLGAERDQRQRELEAARQELDQSRRERDSARQELDAMRQEGQGIRRELDAIRQQAEAAREDAQTSRRELTFTRQQLDAARERFAAEDHARQEEARRQADAVKSADAVRVAERQEQLAVVERLLTAIRAMDAGRSLSDVLSSLASAAAVEAARVGLFVVNGTELRGWKATGFTAEALPRVDVSDEGLLGDAIRSREPVVTAAGPGPAAPEFASLPPDRAAIAVPLVVGSQAVAVLYADDGSDGPAETPASWPEAVQILGRHASACLAHLTAARTADVMRRSSPAQGAVSSVPMKEDGTSARRYARLLVSEIKLYNEAAVRLGRQKGDLLERLKPEIDRARKLYTQRISPAVDARGTLFHQELVQTLADGDASLLGNPA